MARNKSPQTFEKRQRERRKQMKRLEKLERRLERKEDKRQAKADGLEPGQYYDRDLEQEQRDDDERTGRLERDERDDDGDDD